MNIFDEIKESFKTGSALTKLIYINLAVFLIIRIVGVFYFLFNVQDIESLPIVEWLAVPAGLTNLLLKPWTLFTYMFLHLGFLHILFNVLCLYWFGKIFLEYLSEKQLVGVYILGGLAGAFLYIIAFNGFPVFQPVLQDSYALGASAAVLAIVIAISVYVPDYTIHILFLGQVKLKYIAIFAVSLDILSIASSNAGGHIAHLGGAIFGYLYIQKYKQGKDISVGFNRFLNDILSIFKKKKKIKVSYKRPKTDIEYNEMKVNEQDEINRILDKISKAGYESLSKTEKETLFKISNKK
ncbi:MAG: rhomboid family intramembrane serine protease [Bacteroidales bacterium]|nr:rhomboid family intramembrane serine protease [Bacteroidales bacterium]